MEGARLPRRGRPALVRDVILSPGDLLRGTMAATDFDVRADGYAGWIPVFVENGNLFLVLEASLTPSFDEPIQEARLLSLEVDGCPTLRLSGDLSKWSRALERL